MKKKNRHSISKQSLCSANFPNAGKKRKNIALFLCKSLPDSACAGLWQVTRVHYIPGVAYIDGILSAFTLDQGGIHKICKRTPIRRCGHGQHAEIRPEFTLKVQAEPQSRIQIQRALMHLIKQDSANPIQCWVCQKAPYKQPFRHNFNTRSA
ncbi:hypothetical protein AA0229_0969 [Gluconobacter cerinus NRIC 0229]|nr:hypothetical protein AA0229_0969 [Gluconobacter cerinus NRIC 0229]